MIVIGAGLAGLLAGSLFQKAKLFEAGPEDQINHRAVLRFRSSAVGDATGIEFRRVTVHKGLWFDGRFQQPDIRLANLYSNKVIGRLADRSVWNLAPAERFIAPHDLVQQLAERCAGRIEWNSPVSSIAGLRDRGDDHHIVSTMPLPLLNKIIPLSLNGDTPKFNYAPIFVRRFTVPNADVFQTIYFPEPGRNLYRASITGNLLIAEYMNAPDRLESLDIDMLKAFGLSPEDVHRKDETKQRFGKISPIDNNWRRQFILNATLQHGVYSLGRFATWRNILMDDVLKDISVIKKLISGGAYAATRSC